MKSAGSLNTPSATTKLPKMSAGSVSQLVADKNSTFPLINLPTEIIARILEVMDPSDWYNMQFVSKHIQEISQRHFRGRNRLPSRNRAFAERRNPYHSFLDYESLRLQGDYEVNHKELYRQGKVRSLSCAFCRKVYDKSNFTDDQASIIMPMDEGSLKIQPRRCKNCTSAPRHVSRIRHSRLFLGRFLRRAMFWRQ